MKGDIRFYLTVFLKRSWILILVLLIGVPVSVLVAINLAPLYKSEATLLVEAPQISDALAESTVQTTAREQLQVTRQRLMTRANMISIAREFNVFEDIAEMTPDTVVRMMRQNTEIRTSGGRDRATIMTIAFTAENPQIAAAVANKYVTIVLDENVRYRTQRAELTEDFFVQEVERLERELQLMSVKILEYKSSVSDALPSTVEHRLDRLETLQTREEEYQRELISLNSRLERLNDPDVDSDDFPELSATRTAQEQKLRQMRADLAEASAVYSETNPRLRILQSRIRQQEEVLASIGGLSDSEEVAELVEQLEEQFAFVQAASERTQEAIATLEETIERTPGVQIELEGMERDYRNLQSQYNSAVNRLAVAQTGERIELLSQGERVTVVEQAAVPNEPFAPDRKKAILKGALLAAALGMALIVGLEMLNTSIRRPKQLVDQLGITPLAVLPYLPTARAKRNRRLAVAAAAVVVLVGIPAGLAAVHQYYMPLDLLVERVVERLNA